MKSTNYISPLMLEMYHMGALSAGEQKRVEAEMALSGELFAQYQAIKEADGELRRRYPMESFPALAGLKDNVIPFSKTGTKPARIVWVAAAAAIVLCAAIPSFVFVKNHFFNRESGGIAAVEPAALPEPTVVNSGTDDIIAEAKEPQQDRDPAPSADNKVAAPETGTKPALPPAGNDYIAAVPPPTAPGTDMETTASFRGGSDPSAAPNIFSVPQGLTFVFEGMYADRQLDGVVIHDGVTFIGKNAFADNPLVSVTIGENVSVEDNAIPGNFAAVYERNGKTAGTYKRSTVSSDEWVKQ